MIIQNVQELRSINSLQKKTESHYECVRVVHFHFKHTKIHYLWGKWNKNEMRNNNFNSDEIVIKRRVIVEDLWFGLEKWKGFFYSV